MGKRILMDRESFENYKRIHEARMFSKNKPLNEAFYEEDDMDMIDNEEGPIDDYERDSQSNGDASELLTQIRKLALDGLSQFGEQVDSEEYEFFKKTWLSCDKALSQKTEGQKEQ